MTFKRRIGVMCSQWLLGCMALIIIVAMTGASAHAADGSGLVIPVNRAELIVMPEEMAEVMVANPEIADIHIHGASHFSVIGKSMGKTNIRVFDKKNNILRSFDVLVTYDLPAIRKSLKNFFPYEYIGVELVNTNIALVGDVSSAVVAEKAVRVVNEYLKTSGAGDAKSTSSVVNLMQIKSGQQVMLRVRVGEIQRDAVKKMGISLSFFNQGAKGGFTAGTNGNIAAALNGLTPTGLTQNGLFAIDSEAFGFAGALFGTANSGISGSLDALEKNGLFKVLAEPNLVALSGEKAEFLAGGEFPIPTSNGSGDSSTISVQYKPFGVAVQFMPFVLTNSRIRLTVQPEVSEIVGSAGVVQGGLNVPTISARRAKTTIELAPGESFMIAGLLKDQMTNTISQVPGLAEIPIFSALLRSTEFRRNETELVIAVTPYLVDPVGSGDIKLPTDDFRPATLMESVFYGALGSTARNASRVSQTPPLEGPIGFMVD